MGDPSNMFGGGGGSKRVVNNKATAKAQAASNANAQNQFKQNYNALFTQGPTNQGFTDSLSGYYGGATLQDIAAKLAKTNAFQPKVQNVTRKVQTGGDGGFLGMLDPMGLASPDKFMNPQMPNFNIF